MLRIVFGAPKVVGVVSSALFLTACDPNDPDTRELRCVEDCGFSYAITTIDGRINPEFVFDLNSTVVRDRHGRLIVSAGSSYLPDVFDSTGMFLRPLARRGNGPGELSRSFAIEAGSDDSVRVFSWPKVSVFGPDLTLARVFSLNDGPATAHVEILADGRILVKSRQLEGPKQVTLTRIFGADGDVLRALDLAQPERQLRSPRVGAAKGRSAFWGIRSLSGERPGYELALYSDDGTPTREIEREPQWWIRPSRDPEPDVSSIPVDVYEDEQGRIAVLVAQPKHNWRAITAAGEDRANLFDTVIEVLASNDGSVIGMRRLNGYPMGILHSNHVATFYEVDDHPVLDIIRISYPLSARAPQSSSSH